MKTAVVTGACGALGSELCKLIAAQGVGLVLVDRNAAKSKSFATELDRLYPGCVKQTLTVDLTDHADIRRLTTELLARVETIDYLFNNAGVLTDSLQFSKNSNELHFEVNTLAPLQLIDQLRPALQRAAGGAVVVNTSAGISLGAKQLVWEELIKPTSFKKLYGPYVNSKQALNVLTAALGRELAADAIRVRAADPGPNKSPLTKGKGTPFWMRLFYGLLPGPEKGAKKLFDVGFAPAWANATSIFVTGGKAAALPPELASDAFQQEFLRKCRERVAEA